MEIGMKKIGLLLVVVVLLVAIPATVFLVGRSQELRKRAAPATSLAFSPATISKKVNDTFSIEATIDTGTNQVVAAELHITFDPVKLEAQTITSGALFPNILASGVVDRGTASITVGAASATKPVTGTGTIAVIKFKALDKTDTPVQIRFAPNTFVGSLGEGSTNVLVGSTPANITITNGATGAGTLTPTPTPKVASPSGQASPSAVLISSPAKDGSTNSTTPKITGKAAPNSTVTITIYSTPQTVVVTADEMGNWTYTPTTPLDPGPHSIVATATDASGATQTSTTSFVITEATESAQPVAGTMEVTYVLLALAVLFLLSGVTTALVIR